MPLFAAIVLTVFPAAVIYVWSVRTFPWAARKRAWVIGALVVLGALQTATHRLDLRSHSRFAGGVHLAFVTFGVAMAIASLPLAPWTAARWLIDRRRPPSEAQQPTFGLTRRQVIDASVGAALFGATGSMLGWGLARGRHDFELSELPVVIPELPRALDGYVVVQMSDIHAGALVGEPDIDRGLDLAQSARPDLVVVTGDLVDSDPTYAPFIARKLGTLAARDGVVACLGNHDHYAGPGKVQRALRAAGLDVLVNAGRVVRPGDGGGFALLGVDDLSARRRGREGPSLERAIAAVPRDLPRILLSHQPPTVENWAGRVALQLSGHTHGGQINPGSILTPMFKYIAGRYAVGATTLYVNRGIGTVGPPARVGARPEVARIVLVAG